MNSRVKFRLLILSAAAVVCTAGPALAQSQGAGGEGGSASTAGGSTVSSGSSSSSASVQTSGGANAGIVQGNVAEGSSASGSSSSGDGTDQSGSANSGDSVSGQVAGADAPNAVNEGVVSQLDIPAVGTVEDALPASRQGPDVLMWGAVALVVAGLAVLYRRLPRPTRA
jgi:hypothetical protein